MNENTHQPEARPHGGGGPEQPVGNLAAVREGIRCHGEAFLAYLILDGVEQRSPDIVEQFETAFYEYFADRRSFIESQLEHLQWQDQLESMTSGDGIWSGDLAWDYDGLWNHLNTLYRTTERLGGVYVFTR